MQVMTDKEYRALPNRVYSTMLKTIESSSEKHLDKKFEGTPSTEFGTLAHMFFLEPERFNEEVTVIPEFVPISKVNIEKYVITSVNGIIKEVKPDYRRTKEYREQKENFEANNTNCITVADHARLVQMKDSVTSETNEHFNRFLTGGDEELSITINSFITNVKGKEIESPVKARLDYVTIDGDTVYIVDLKTCQDASPRAFKRTIISYSYDLQAAFYTDVLKQYYFTREKKVVFLWLAVESLPPYGFGWYQMSQETYQYGFNKYSSVIERATAIVNGSEKRGYSSSSKIEMI